jgi:hypothetical protein
MQASQSTVQLPHCVPTLHVDGFDIVGVVVLVVVDVVELPPRQVSSAVDCGPQPLRAVQFAAAIAQVTNACACDWQAPALSSGHSAMQSAATTPQSRDAT